MTTFSPAFSVVASVTRVAVFTVSPGSSANTDTGSRETSMTSDRRALRIRLLICLFIKLSTS